MITIDQDPNATGTHDPNANGVGKPGFNESGGVETIVGSEWLNNVQEELVGLVENAGASLDTSNKRQLAAILNGARVVYGDGSDGDHTFTAAGSPHGIAVDMFYENLTLEAGAVVNTGGRRIFVRNKLTMGDGARISCDGEDGEDCVNVSIMPVGGAGGGGFTLGGGGQGGNGNNNPGITSPAGSASPYFSPGGAGGDGGLGDPPTGGAGGAGGTNTMSSLGMPRDAQTLTQGLVPMAVAAAASTGWKSFGGGAGGGGGGAPTGGASYGGAGGGGGGVAMVAAYTIVCPASPSVTPKITANGGDGGGDTAGGGVGGGGGGGGGGVACLVYRYFQQGSITLQAAGGSAGGSLTGGPGTAGASGVTISSVA